MIVFHSTSFWGCLCKFWVLCNVRKNLLKFKIQNIFYILGSVNSKLSCSNFTLHWTWIFNPINVGRSRVSDCAEGFDYNFGFSFCMVWRWFCNQRAKLAIEGQDLLYTLRLCSFQWGVLGLTHWCGWSNS